MANCKVGLPTRLVAPGVWAVLPAASCLLVHLAGCFNRHLAASSMF